MRRIAAIVLWTALRGLGATAVADDIVGPLSERISAASVVVEGTAGRSYAAWDGADPATICTYTPFTVWRVLKGDLLASPILLRQPGGEIGGVQATQAAAAEFADGEHVILLLGEQDARDRSYDIAGRRQGKYHVTLDSTGLAGVDVRLGVDAEAYSNREKAPGTLLARIPLELIVRLARGDHFDDLAEFAALPPDRPPEPAVRQVAALAPPPAVSAPARPSAIGWLEWLAVACGVVTLGMLIWRRARGSR